MADVHFKCPACEQSLVAEDTAAGLMINCPHCSKPLQIPFPTQDLSDARAQKSLSKWINRATILEGELRAAQQRLAETESQYAESQVALAELEQRLHATAAEGSCVQAEANTEKYRRESLETALQVARAESATAMQEIDELQTARGMLELQKEQAERELAHLRKLLEACNGERNELLVDFAQKSAAHAESLIRLDGLRKERHEVASILQRTQTELAHVQEKAATLEQERSKLAEELATAGTELPRLQKALVTVTQERDKLLATIRQDPKLSDVVALKAAREQTESDLREVQAALADVRNKLHVTRTERDTLRSENKALHLKISALRDARSHTQLIQDNETLRGVIERLNEELKERGPAPKKRRADSGSRMGEVVRAAWTRCFVSNPDTMA